MSFSREDLKRDAVEILEWETGLDCVNSNDTLVQRIWDLMERCYDEGYAEAETGVVDDAAQHIRATTAESYPRILAERGADYAAGWSYARMRIADELEGIEG